MNRLFLVAVLVLSGCATTDIQPLDQNTFKIATTAAPACGPSGARKVANQAAAIEVIRRGGDRFVFLTSEEDTFRNWGGDANFQQGLIVRLVDPRSSDARAALSARQILGPDWEKIFAKGVPQTC